MLEIKKKNWGVTHFVLERTCAEEHLNLSKSGFVSEESHSGCKSQNIAIGALKGAVLCQIWSEWTYLANLVNNLKVGPLLVGPNITNMVARKNRLQEYNFYESSSFLQQLSN